jgi:hypothetical protein
VVLYELLTGERPAGTDVPSDLNKDVPKFLDDVFRRSYSRLEKRFASADEFVAALSAMSPPPLSNVSMTQAIAPRGLGGDFAHCPSCRREIDGHDQFCMHCGVQLVAQVRRCTRCGAYPDLTDQYCIFCGETLSPQAKTTTV